MSALCNMCHADTTSDIPGVPWEYYMVKDTIWPAQYAHLCLTCLELELGRNLVRDDFSDAPLNDLTKWPSAAIEGEVVDFNVLLDPNSKNFQHRTRKLHDLLSHE